MVTLIKYGALSGGEKYNVNVLSLDGLSTDTKPIRTYIEYGSDGREVGRTGIPNGSVYTEIDTGDTYMYDADGATWHKVSIGGGSGGTIDTQVNGTSTNAVQNKAIYNFTNSSIATNTAYYISNNGQPFTSVAQLEAYTGEVSNNDYAFVRGTDLAGNTYYDRYKATVVDDVVAWAKEYRLNNSSFTSNQWETINSGFTASDKTAFDNLIEQIETNTDDIAINRAELVELVDNGNKNLLEITAKDKSISGVTFTVDEIAGTVTVNSDGTNTASAFFYLRDRADSALKSELMNKTVVLSGCPEGGSSTTYRLRCWHYDGTNIAADYGEGAEFTFTAEDDYDITIQVYPGAIMDNVVFRPMICTKTAWDISQKYVPNKLYTTVNGIRLYVSSTAPTGDIPDGSVGVGW